MPAFNEEATIEQVIQRVFQRPEVGELLVVDDASRDGTRSLLKKACLRESRLRVLHHHKNLGKGAALRTGIAAAIFPFVVIQDADLEYDPAEYPAILEPLVENKADVVYGSRFLGGRPHRVLLS